MTRTMTCIVCPKGCALLIGDAEAPREGSEIPVEGAGCKRGLEYARRELIDPRRVLTSTVRTSSPSRRRLPVRSAAPIPLPRLLEAAKALDGILLSPPITCGRVIATDWLGLGVDLLAADDLE
ncbi:MAG TPA: DUF1667 domain-containing protein [Rectinemataceae bacterium]|nr:DUF1667 domain-containing protein [Rectinemataceae bacterium]